MEGVQDSTLQDNIHQSLLWEPITLK
jgi:hypothetical protein